VASVEITSLARRGRAGRGEARNLYLILYRKEKREMELHKNVCRVKIESIGPGILLHNPQSMMRVRGGRKEIPTAEEEADRACYWMPNKSSLAFPAENLRCGLIRAASGWKVPGDRKLSLQPILAGDISIEPEYLSFHTKKYEIDSRRVVVQRQGVIRSRPKLSKWELEFEVRWEAQYLGKDFHKTILPDLLERLGKTIGLGDFRPEHRGPFGRFLTVKMGK
jgi:hypothetical protein